MSAAIRTRASIYSTSVGKKYAMAISGFVLMAYVLLHMLGNLNLYWSVGALDSYAEWLRTVGTPALPRATLLWVARVALLAAAVVHLHSAYTLTMINRRARPDAYRSPRDWAAADFASRTMRWTGVIVLLFLIWHILDLTIGPANPDFVSGDPRHNVIASFERWPVAIGYVIANLALAAHLYHGVWSFFQSLGLVFKARRGIAIAFAALVVAGNVSFPLSVLFGVVN